MTESFDSVGRVIGERKKREDDPFAPFSRPLGATSQEARTGARGRGLREDVSFGQTAGEEPQGLLDIREVQTERGPATFVTFTPRGQRLLLETAPGLIASMTPVGVPLRLALSAVAGASGSMAAEGVDPSENPKRRALLNALLEVGGEAIPAGAGRMFGRRSSKMKPGAEVAEKMLAERGQHLLPAQATTSYGTDLLQTAGESSLLTGGIIRAQKERTMMTAQDMIEEFARQLGRTAEREEAGEVIEGAFRGLIDSHQTAVKQAYAAVDDVAPFQMAPRTRTISEPTEFVDASGRQLMRQREVQEEVIVGGGVDIRPVKEWARRRLDPESGFPPEGIAQMLRELLNRPDRITFREAAARRSALGRAGAVPQEQFKGEAKGVADQLFKRFDQQIEEAGQSLNKEALQAWRSATKLARMGHQEFNNKFVRSLLREQPPERVFDLAVRNAQPSSIRRVRQNLMKIKGGEEKWRTIQGQWLHEIIRDTSEEGALSGRKFAGRIRRFSDARLKELFPNATERERLRGLARTIELAEAEPDSGAFKMAFRFGQIGAVTGLGGAAVLGYGAEGAGTAASVLLPPAALGYIMKTPGAYKLLVTGFKAPPGSRQASSAFTKLGTRLLEAGVYPGQQEASEQGLREALGVPQRRAAQ